MSFVHGTSVYVWKEKLFGKPSFKESRLSIYNNGRILWEKEEKGKEKGQANLKDVFGRVRIGILDSEIKRERAADEGFTLAYHTLILPVQLTKPTSQPGYHEKEFAVGFEREMYDWMQAMAGVLGGVERFHEIVLKYRLRKKYNVYSGSSHVGLSQLGDTLKTADEDTADGGDPARLWSAAHGASEDYVAIWAVFQEQMLADMSASDSGINSANGYSCGKCWQAN